MRGRRSGSWERVEAARRQARLALGKDPDAPDDYGGRPKPRSTLPPPAPASSAPVATGPVEYGLFLGEAATRLNLSRAELEVHAATIETAYIDLLDAYGVKPTGC